MGVHSLILYVFTEDKDFNYQLYNECDLAIKITKNYEYKLVKDKYGWLMWLENLKTHVPRAEKEEERLSMIQDARTNVNAPVVFPGHVEQIVVVPHVDILPLHNQDPIPLTLTIKTRMSWTMIRQILNGSVELAIVQKTEEPSEELNTKKSEQKESTTNSSKVSDSSIKAPFKGETRCPYCSATVKTEDVLKHHLENHPHL